MGILLDLLNLSVYLPFLRPDENDIVRNIQRLKKEQWFRNYLKEPTYKALIIHNEEIRQTIGRFKIVKLKRNSYNVKCKKRLHRALLRASA